MANSALFWYSPLLRFFLMLFRLTCLSNLNKRWVFEHSLLLFLLLSSCAVFPLFFAGFARKRKFRLLGGFRGASQVIAYEVSAVFLLLFPLVLSGSFKTSSLLSKWNFIFFLAPIIFIFWVIAILCETKRAPFDFAEGERELVSGFNTEYSSLGFTLLFLAEYGSIILISLLTSIIFFSFLFFIFFFFASIYILMVSGFFSSISLWSINGLQMKGYLTFSNGLVCFFTLLFIISLLKQKMFNEEKIER